MKKFIVLSVLSACLVTFAQTAQLGKVNLPAGKSVIGFKHSFSGQKILTIGNFDKMVQGRDQERAKIDLNQVIEEQILI